MLSSQESAAHLAEATELAAGFFEPFGELGALTPVGESELPADYLTLLAHRGHMTITLEAWHESLVDVRVEGEQKTRDAYARHSLLTRQTDGRVVQSGVMRIDLRDVPEQARQKIELGETPLGRILIQNNVLREVELLALWRIAAGPRLAEELAIAPGGVIYGRSARIIVNGRPRVELLEIVRP